jgi:hypothetical protein
MTLVSIAAIPFVFAGVFIESRIISGQGLKEKIALETATRVSHSLNSKL